MWAFKTSSCTSIFCFFGAESCEAVVSRVLRLGYQYELCLPCWVPAAICRCQLSHLAAVALGCKQNQNAQIVGNPDALHSYFAVFRSRSMPHCPTLSNCHATPSATRRSGRRKWSRRCTRRSGHTSSCNCLRSKEPSANIGRNERVETCRKDQRKMFSGVFLMQICFPFSLQPQHSHFLFTVTYDVLSCVHAYATAFKWM